MKRKNKKLTQNSFIDAVLEALGNPSKNGVAFEKTVLALQKSFGFDVFGYKDIRDKDMSDMERVIIKNVPYDTLRKQASMKLDVACRTHPGRSEFVLIAKDIKNTKEFPCFDHDTLKIRIECKYQCVSGTTDQKLAYAALDLRYSIPERNAILLMDGPGFKKEMISLAKEWCKSITWDEAPVKKPSNVVVMSLIEFMDWSNRAFYVS